MCSVGMHMNNNEDDRRDLPIFPIVGSAHTETVQFTNNFDGILRDGNGDPIQLDLRDYIHQAYHGEERSYLATGRKPKYYVFKDGRLFEVPNLSEDAVQTS